MLPSALMSIVVESFLPCYSARKPFPHGPVKIAELGCELSFLGLVCIARGIMYEGYMHSPVHCDKSRRIYHTVSQRLIFVLPKWLHYYFLTRPVLVSLLFKMCL